MQVRSSVPPSCATSSVNTRFEKFDDIRSWNTVSHPSAAQPTQGCQAAARAATSLDPLFFALQYLVIIGAVIPGAMIRASIRSTAV